jgi:hypothetical protein
MQHPKSNKEHPFNREEEEELARLVFELRDACGMQNMRIADAADKPPEPKAIPD